MARRPMLPALAGAVDHMACGLLRASKPGAMRDAERELKAVEAVLRHVQRRFEGFAACPIRGCGHLQCSIVRRLARLDRLTGKGARRGQ